MPVRVLVSSLSVMMLAGLSGCATKGACPPGVANAQPGLPAWRDAVTDGDHVRLRGWRKAFVDSLADARAHGHGAEIDAEGRLLYPDAGMDDAALPIGFYRCRMIKLGAKQPGHRDFVAYPAERCQVRPSDHLLRLVQLGGIQRPSGRIYPDSSSRSIFLGTMVLSDESKPIAYGRDQDRDMIGAIERVGDHRWRMLMPYPTWESQMDVMELVPEP